MKSHEELIWNISILQYWRQINSQLSEEVDGTVREKVYTPVRGEIWDSLWDIVYNELN